MRKIPARIPGDRNIFRRLLPAGREYCNNRAEAIRITELSKENNVAMDALGASASAWASQYNAVCATTTTKPQHAVCGGSKVKHSRYAMFNNMLQIEARERTRSKMAFGTGRDAKREQQDNIAPEATKRAFRRKSDPMRRAKSARHPAATDMPTR